MTQKIWQWGSRLLVLVIGLFIFAFGNVLIVKAHLGANPWNVFHLGLTNYLPLTLGRASQTTGLSLILLSLLLGVYPGVATIGNMFMVGFFVDLIIANGWAVDQYSLVPQLLQLVIGLVVVGIGSGIYMQPGLGAGPRDSLMLAFNRKYGWSIARSRTTLEVTALTVGWALGGEFGIGTVVFSLAVGRFVAWGMRLSKKIFSTRLFVPMTSLWPTAQVTKPAGDQQRSASGD